MNSAVCRKIYGMARQIGIDNDSLHCLVSGVTGSDSIKALTDKQAQAVIHELGERMELAGVIPKRSSRKKYETRHSDGMTEEQCRKAFAQIYELMRLDGAGNNSDEAYRRLNGAIIKITGNNMGTRKEPFKGLSSEDGRQLIDMLKRYIYTAEKKAYKKKGAANGR